MSSKLKCEVLSFLLFKVVGCVQAFYAEFGELMMRQPVIGLDFQSYLPIAIVPYMLLLVFNGFNRYSSHDAALL